MTSAPATPCHACPRCGRVRVVDRETGELMPHSRPSTGMGAHAVAMVPCVPVDRRVGAVVRGRAPKSLGARTVDDDGPTRGGAA